jgi:hypothetical protein
MVHMIKKTATYVGILLAFVLAGGFSADSVKTKDPFLGTWVFSIPQAPWEYSTGRIVIETSDENAMTGRIIFNNGYEVRIGKLTRLEEKLVMETTIEGFPVKTVVTRKEDTITGHTETPDGNIPFTAKRYIPEA